MNIIKWYHERSERLKREKGNTGHIYLEFGPDGALRTVNNESTRSFRILETGEILIEGLNDSRRQVGLSTTERKIELSGQIGVREEYELYRGGQKIGHTAATVLPSSEGPGAVRFVSEELPALASDLD